MSMYEMKNSVKELHLFVDYLEAGKSVEPQDIQRFIGEARKVQSWLDVFFAGWNLQSLMKQHEDMQTFKDPKDVPGSRGGRG